MEEPGSLRVLLDITGGRDLVFQRSMCMPVKKPLLSTSEQAVAMDRLACGYQLQGNLHHGRIGAWLTLTLDLAVNRLVGRPKAEQGVKKKKAQSKGNEVESFFHKYCASSVSIVLLT